MKGREPSKGSRLKREREVALKILLGCACIFSLGHSHARGHSDTFRLGLKSLHRTENNGITGRQIYQEEVH